jgi:hypothetical protein
MATQAEAIQALLDEIVEVRNASMSTGPKATVLLRLAEAYAWISYPNQSHGGQTDVHGS